MLLMISGPPGIGKDSTWIRVAESVGYRREVPLTTRQPRAHETPGLHYEFRTAREFQALIKSNSLTEWDFVLGSYYGTLQTLQERVSKEEDVVLQVLGRMAIRLRRRFTQSRCILLQTSDINSLIQRYKTERGYNQIEIDKRVELLKEETVHSPLFDLIVPDADFLPDDQVERMIVDLVK